MPSAEGRATRNIAADSSHYASTPHDALARSPHADASTVAVRSPSVLSQFANRGREQIVLRRLRTSVRELDAYKNIGNFPISFATFPISAKFLPIYFWARESSEVPVRQQFSAFLSPACGNLRVFPIIFPISAHAGLETGSRASASATKHSLERRDFPVSGKLRT
jgi:hypothetical protein